MCGGFVATTFFASLADDISRRVIASCAERSPTAEERKGNTQCRKAYEVCGRLSGGGTADIRSVASVTARSRPIFHSSSALSLISPKVCLWKEEAGWEEEAGW